MRVPETIPECFEILDAIVDEPFKSDLTKMEEADLNKCLNDLGKFILNNWLYNDQSLLLRTFERLGLHWKDKKQLCLFLIKLYWQYLNGEDYMEQRFIEQFRFEITI